MQQRAEVASQFTLTGKSTQELTRNTSKAQTPHERTVTREEKAFSTFHLRAHRTHSAWHVARVLSLLFIGGTGPGAPKGPGRPVTTHRGPTGQGVQNDRALPSLPWQCVQNHGALPALP